MIFYKTLAVALMASLPSLRLRLPQTTPTM